MSLCRVTQYDCKNLDEPLALLHVWDWERMPFLATIRRLPTFPLACRWNEYNCPSMEYKCLILAHVKHMLDNMQYDNIHPRMWLAPSLLISFECIE
ncbi:hypothetical protein AHAS_Ahas19G0254100 [Arachis hypogaea]